MRTFSFVVFSILAVSSASGLLCETCDGSTCFDRDRWVQELCPPSTQFCYRLSSNGTAFRRGCADFPCARMPGVEPGSGVECRTCSEDRCNNERDNFFHQHGGGVSWNRNSAENRLVGPVLTSLFTIVMFTPVIAL